MNLNYIKQK